MKLSKLDNMFTEKLFVESAGESKASSSLVDLNSGIRKLSVSPIPYESTSARAVVSSDVSSSGGLLLAFDSISFAKKPFLRNGIAKVITESGAIGSFCEANLHGQRPNEWQGPSTRDSSDSARIHGSSGDRDAEADVVDEFELTQNSNDHLIIYTSSKSNISCNINGKLNQNNDSQDPSRNCCTIAQNDSLSDLKSLQIARRKRSLLSKRAKSSVWGLEHLPSFKKNNELNPCFSIGEKIGGVRDGQGKVNVIRDQTGQKSVQKSSTPAGCISLKIKIGNQCCGVINVDEKIIASQKKSYGGCDIKENKFGEELPGKMLLPHENHFVKMMTSDASALGTLLDVTGSVENKSLRASTENRCSDSGTSPDSEVINSVPDASLFERGTQDIPDSQVMPTQRSNKKCLANSSVGVPFPGVSSLSSPKIQSRKGKKTTDAVTKHKGRAPPDHGLRQKPVDISKCDDSLIIPPANPLQNAFNRPRFASGPAGCSRMSNSETPCSTSNKLCGGSEVNPFPELSDATEFLKLQAHKSLNACNEGQKFLRCSRAKGGCTSRTGIMDFPLKKGKASGKKSDKKNNSIVKHQIEDDGSGVLSRVESHLEAGNQILPDLGEVGVGDLTIHSARPGFVSSSDWLNCQYGPPRNAWVLCDECQKWRRIPATLANQIEQTNCKWTCKDNTDKDFADCSIPQEKSNSEINKELDISDASCDEDNSDTFLKSNKNKSTAVKQSSWTLIKANMFLHRSRKTQNIDEVMVCHCKPPSDGRMGCGANCLNRMLNIECVQGTCPCGEICSNQQFQKRIYAKLKWLRCGKKGFGLQALQDISEGQFLIEYVGEVLDIHAHEARQREYALQGHKHFYFMTLNGSEWMVNGEVCVGLFTIRDIKKGEEVTFDYNYVRVFGAAAKKCVCRSPNCRGYIGGDPTNLEVIVQEDSDDENAEPVMICEDREMTNDWTYIMSQSLFEIENGSRDELQEDRYRMKNANPAGQSESITSDTAIEKLGVSSVSATLKAESESLLSQTSSPVNLMKASFHSEEIPDSTMSLALHFDNELKMSSAAIPGKLQLEAVESKKKLKHGTMGGKEELKKFKSLAKTRYSALSIRKGKFASNIVNDKGTADEDKANAVRHKSKKLSGHPLTGHVESVEWKLNELLDTEGGISKRKDASRGYLKLLFLTAASGTNEHGEAIQSNRDLSMILDALLKTKSRTVLVDIIDKNGLQMLHNIMKRYRKEFIKTPILRKLLKVLEYLAMREILTLEHIAGGPTRPGVESVKDSILTLTEHDDKQVHQIARNFRDKWIPKSLRKVGKTEFCQHSICGKLSVSSGDHWSDEGGKHADSVECCNKQPVVPSSGETPTLHHSSASRYSYGTNGIRTRKHKSRWDNPAADECIYPKKPNVDDDIPPGFSSPCNDPAVLATTSPTALSFRGRDAFREHPSDILLADPQERFTAHLPVSYGIPSSVVQQFGVRETKASPVWTVAPGLPFHPFPPLPPCASDRGEQPTLVAKCVGEPVEKMGQDNAACYSGKKHRMSCSLDPPERNITMAGESPDFQPGEGSFNLGRKYFRQQKSKLAPPWLRMKNGWGYSASTRNGVPSVDFGNGTNQFADSYT